MGYFIGLLVVQLGIYSLISAFFFSRELEVPFIAHSVDYEPDLEAESGDDEGHSGISFIQSQHRHQNGYDDDDIHSGLDLDLEIWK